MIETLNLIAPFFTTPKTYAEMLAKLAGAAFYVCYFSTFFLRQIHQVNEAFKWVELHIPSGPFAKLLPDAAQMNIAGAVCAIVLAILSHISHLHDRISDVFGIRKRFDRNHILIPLAKLVGAKLSKSQLLAMDSERHRLMKSTFYRYASSRRDQPLVDRHDIEHALGAWAWHWTFLEAATFFYLALLVSLLFHAMLMSLSFFALIALSVLSAFMMRPRLKGYAQAEIEAIAADPTAKKDVRKVFNAL